MPTCLRRLSRSHNLLKQFTPSPFVLQVRLQSNPRNPIRVTSDIPQAHRPTKQQNKWTVLADGSPTLSSKVHQFTPEDESPTYFEEKEPAISREDKTGEAICYNAKERRLRYILLRTTNILNESRPPENHVGVYFVGGWVRDKLMGKESPDIDIALQNISPSEFIQAMIDIQEMDSHSPRLVPKAMCKYSKSKNTGDLGKARDLTVGTYKFEYDAGQGKMFEVAGIYFFSLTMKLEFTALKGEGEGVQKMQEDAMQRDLTINAIHHTMNRKILDLTESGLDDLQNGILRCPRGKQTLLDDPLRVLRIIRLASRYHSDGFTIEENTFAAMTDPEVRVSPPSSCLTVARVDNSFSTLQNSKRIKHHSQRTV
jgi:hypothetical protein